MLILISFVVIFIIGFILCKNGYYDWKDELGTGLIIFSGIVFMKYAIKRIKSGKYYTENDGWSKDIMKALLFDCEFDDEYLDYHFHGKAKHVPIKETYTREEVKE